MKKILAALITTAAMVAGPALVFTAPAANAATGYTGSVPTTCHANAVRRVNPRNRFVPFRFRVTTGGNGRASGKVFFTVFNRRTGKSFVTSRNYGGAHPTWRFRKGLPRGRYVVRTEFFAPNGSVYTNCKTTFRFRVVRRR
ncbi:MAG: hypothetical protein Q8Q02_06700 [Nocardioides sp.]|nr:hypothetical protein [Nocardioides sp.]